MSKTNLTVKESELNISSMLERLLFMGSSLLEVNRWVVVILFSLSFIYLWKRRSKTNYPLGPRKLPFVGSIDYFRSKSHLRLTNLKDRYGDIYSIKTGNYNTIVVCSLGGILEGLSAGQELFSGRPDFKSNDLLYLGNRQRGIATADLGSKTKVKRQFVQDSMDSYCCAADNCVEQKITDEIMSLICYFLQQSDQIKEFDPAECFKFAHLHIMLKLVFDEPYSPDDDTVDEMFDCLDLRFSAEKRKLSDYFPILATFSDDEFKEMGEKSLNLLKHLRHYLNKHKDTYHPSIIRDTVDQLLLFLENDEDNGEIETEDIDYLLLTLMSSGFGAVPALLTWLLGYMVAFPEIQIKVQKELDEVVGRKRFPNLSDQPYLPYTTAVIMEVQRIVTLFPFLLPHRTMDSCIFQGYDIPKDTLMLFNVWSVHHDNRYWRNPVRFDPNRFLNDSGALSIPDFYLPYGTGERRCPGESLVDVEAFLFFTHLLHQLTFTRGSQIPNLEGEYNYVISPKPFKITLETRD
ncbi:cytochrome P450 1A5-like [Mizuhopecten yessoensis]|uniref:cytochrome P450 1A5-like n=1 Tax=Mizuhopecten yessoensis TaxID=6573 RepID=UPI000B45BAEB|nr:cytochrome P450 1A5-like [Mizuhopecten yessoensis]